MAEALSIAASGIAVAQIAGQVGKAVLKLKRLWDEVKDVPDNIADLMQQIDCIGPVLWEVENNMPELPSMLWNNSATKRNTEYCHKALAALTGCVNELNMHIDSRKRASKRLGAIKVVLKKDQLSKLEKRLGSALRMLSFAQQSYLITLTRVQPERIIQEFIASTSQLTESVLQRISENMTASVTPKDIGLTQEYSYRPQPASITKPKRKRGNDTFRSIFGHVFVTLCSSGQRIRLEVPEWLLRKSWELQSFKAHGAWQFHINSYSTRPYGSQVFSVARCGKARQLQQLFDNGEASLYDRDCRGRNLLHFAAYGYNLDMIRFLINMGLSASEYDNHGLTPREEMKTSHFNSWFNRGMCHFYDNFLSEKFLVEELLLVHQLDPAVDEDACILRSECSCALGLYNLRTYKALLPYQCPLHPYTPLLGRINAVYEATILATLSPAVLKTMLQPEWNADLRGLCQSFFNIRHQPLISTIARKISSSFYWNTSLDDIYSIEDGSSWFSLAVEVISQTPDVHATDIDRRTALIVLIHDAAFLWFYHPLQMGSRRYNIGKPLISMHRTLEAWLDAMRQVGVDLNDYGRREMELFRQIDLNIIRIGGWLDALRLIGITYGPRPEDWRIHIDEPTDGFAGEFWELIEDKPLPIPGAWIDE